MGARDRLVYVVLLAGILVALPFAAVGLFIAWGATAAALALAMTRPATRPAAAYASAALLLVVAVIVGGAGLVVRGGTGLPSTLFLQDVALAFLPGLLVLPAGVYAAHAAGGRAGRVARWGLGVIAAWMLVFGAIMVFTTSLTEAHIVLALVGGALVLAVLARRAFPPLSRSRA